MDEDYKTCNLHLASATGCGIVLHDHAEATVAALQRIVDKLNAGTSPEDLGRDVELLGRIMARRT